MANKRFLRGHRLEGKSLGREKRHSCMCSLPAGRLGAYTLAVTVNIGPMKCTHRFSLMYIMQIVTIVTLIRHSR